MNSDDHCTWRFAVLFIVLAATLGGGCRKQEGNANPINGAPPGRAVEAAAQPVPEKLSKGTQRLVTDAPVPAADSFVIQKDEFAKILNFHYRSSNRRQPLGVERHFPDQNAGYPKGSILNDDLPVKMWGLRYLDWTTPDAVSMKVPDDPRTGVALPLEMRPPDILKLRAIISKYHQWKENAKAHQLEAGIIKPLGRIGHYEFKFVTPDRLRMDELVLNEDSVALIWDSVTAGLPALRNAALVRIQKAEQMIASEDARRASVNAAKEAEKARIDAILK